MQEVPGEEFKDQDVFLGPILRVSCSQIVEFSKPVTIQLPVSLRSDQEKIPVPSTCRVRVLFLNSDDEEKKWMESQMALNVLLILTGHLLGSR